MGMKYMTEEDLTNGRPAKKGTRLRGYKRRGKSIQSTVHACEMRCAARDNESVFPSIADAAGRGQGRTGRRKI